MLNKKLHSQKFFERKVLLGQVLARIGPDPGAWSQTTSSMDKLDRKDKHACLTGIDGHF